MTHLGWCGAEGESRQPLYSGTGERREQEAGAQGTQQQPGRRGPGEQPPAGAQSWEGALAGTQEGLTSVTDQLATGRNGHYGGASEQARGWDELWDERNREEGCLAGLAEGVEAPSALPLSENLGSQRGAFGGKPPGGYLISKRVLWDVTRWTEEGISGK